MLYVSLRAFVIRLLKNDEVYTFSMCCFLQDVIVMIELTEAYLDETKRLIQMKQFKDINLQYHNLTI